MVARDVLDLTDTRATDPARTGGKAAALSRSLGAGLPALPGFVLTTGTGSDDGLDGRLEDALSEHWRRLTDDGRLSLVVRSSGVSEDAASASLAGQFRTELDVRGEPAFREAVRAVLDSAGPLRDEMAVLVQPFARADVGGIAFAVDPASGKRRLTVAATVGGPDRLVSGEVTGAFFHLGRSGRVRAGDLDEQTSAELDEAGLSVGRRRQLARLVRAAGRLFGGPQDVEWAVVDERLVLFQSRPVTTGSGSRGPLLGPGPVAETFPEPLAPLEVDLWVDPLRDALTEAVVLAGTATRGRAEATPIVDVVGGWVVADLALLDAVPTSQLRTLLNPFAGFRKLRTSWRVGRLRPALPGLARDTLTSTDALLADVPALDTLPDRDLLALLEHGRQALTAVHGYEVLSGMLLRDTGTGGSALQGAVRLALAARAEGLDDEEVVAREPGVLALTAPTICPSVRLPADLAADPSGGLPAEHPEQNAAVDPVVLLREALRLRARWLQELGARAAAELGQRLAARGVLADWAEIRTCRLVDLQSWLVTGVPPRPRPGGEPNRETRPLPTAFRLDAQRRVVPAQTAGTSRRSSERGGIRGLPASQGVVTGTVWDGTGEAPPDAVLVVRTLAPSLAGLLPGLVGLVAETGSPLAHLAILAREQRLPTVVAVPGALDRFPPGSTVRLDGGRGDVRPAANEPADATRGSR